MRIVEVAEWSARVAEHAHRVDAVLAAHPRRLSDGREHPVWQFLFRYYSHTPARLRRWHPGFGVALLGDPDHASWPQYVRVGTPRGDAVTVGAEHVEARRDTLGHVGRLLAATTGRDARFDCFGLHEWAMVYRDSDSRRHPIPLRLSPQETDQVVERLGLRCTHFDAFRFFTDDARDRNHRLLSRDAQIATEQPGCVHAGMDLYKWATKVEALVGSDLVVDALVLAFDLRELDMRAAPYDLADLGLTPIAVETPAGRAEYVRHQRALSRRAQRIRDDLATRCAEIGAAPTATTPMSTGE